ncbi:MAG TPA: cyclic nucleotide-binding domain-containing protein [Bryobacteraceae bacterium]|nr:cyclic nucleotide-binding domain-containing protein [Bryobacteraceae bacterium]
MQTAAIPYRVADFLKQHPPFQFMAEPDLIALAARGRVKFHEPEEYICWQSSPHTPFIYVIQQGSVSLWDESANPPVLRDIRGAGDIIGIERFNGSPASLHSAKAASEVVLYALQAADFEPLLARDPTPRTMSPRIPRLRPITRLRASVPVLTKSFWPVWCATARPSTAPRRHPFAKPRAC